MTSTRTKEAAGSARNWRLVVVGAGFEEVELLDASGAVEVGVLGELLDASGWIVLLDAVDYGGPQRSSCGPVSRRVRLGWRSSPATPEPYEGSYY